MDVLRDGKKETITVKVGDRDAAETVAAENMPLPGVQAAALKAEHRKRFSIPDNINGVLVTGVEPDSPLAGRLAPGVVILNVNREAVKEPRDISKRLRKGRPNAMQLYYDGGYSYLVVRP